MSQNGIDIDSLLAPISEQNPCGEWLRYEGTYDRIVEARREDDETLPQGVWKTKAKRADWHQVVELCSDALRKHTKDLQIAAYLTEAWMSLHGPGGAVAGLRLLAELSRCYWDSIYPLLDGSDADFRLAPFDWLDQRLKVRLKLLPLGVSDKEGQRSYCYADWERTLRPGGGTQAESAADKRDNATLPTQAQIVQSLERTPGADLLQTTAQLTLLCTASEELAQVIDSLVQGNSGVLRQTHKMLEQMLGFFKPWSERASQAVAAVAAVADDPPNTPGPAPAASAPSRIRSRAEAYKLLDHVAEYLLCTEPHSPTGYLLKRAVRWGELPLTQLLVELVPEERNLASIYGLLGIKKGQGAE